MIIKEFRIPLPISVPEYQIGQLFSVADASKNETGNNEGIEVVVNEPRDGGQYTHKIFHLSEKVPGIVRKLAPTGALEIDEKALNAYPYCTTEYDQPRYMEENFKITIITRHRPLERDANGEIIFEDDLHEEENIVQENLAAFKKREIDIIDIANDAVLDCDYKEDEDPKIFKSTRTGRGPLVGNWYNDGNQEPLMCCYKLYFIKFKWWGLQSMVEGRIEGAVRRILHNFHRQVFCWIDKWHGMTMADIRAYEEETKVALDEQIKTGEKRGMTVT